MPHVYDFTNLLRATTEPIPRESLICFNNCWLFLSATGNSYEYLVAYRALAYRNGGFTSPAPVYPGQLGTPWGQGWGGVEGPQADVEAIPPAGRTGMFYDGIGLAQVRITTGEGGGLNVVGSFLIPNSDGYEDPRLFRIDDKIYVHSHRRQPFVERGVPAPQHRIYTGYPPHRTPIDDAQNGIFVKINELTFLADKMYLGREYFFGNNVSDRFEKNYGFFYDNGTLNAIYGVAQDDKPMTVLSAIRGQAGQSVGGMPRADRLLVEQYQPNPPEQEYFVHLQAFFARYNPGPAWTIFSTSGPLLFDATRNTWLGVGHVKIKYNIVQHYLRAMATGYCRCNGNNNPTEDNLNTAITALLAGAHLTQQGIAYFRDNPDVTRTILYYYLQAVGQQTNMGDITDDQMARYVRALTDGFAQHSLFGLVNTALSRPHLTPWANNPLNPNTYNNETILHRDLFYLTYFFELAANTYRLERLSNAYLFTTEDTPTTYLQFATSLTPLGNDLFLMGFGRDDNRAQMVVMTRDDLNGYLSIASNAQNYADYSFSFTGTGTTVLNP